MMLALCGEQPQLLTTSSDLGPHGAADLNAAHAWHHKVGDDEIRRPVAVDAETFFGVIRNAAVVPLGHERGTQHARDLRLIVDDKDAFSHVGREYDPEVCRRI